jgi:TonB family protein
MVAPFLLSLIFGFACPATVRAWQDSPVQDGNRLAEVRGLYESAEYDRALAAVDRPNAPVLTPGEARDVGIYEVLCLLALSKKVEANAKIESLIRAEPLYQPSTELPNRLRALVTDTRNRLRPALARSHYAAGKGLFDANKYEAAVEEFELVLQLTDEGPDSSPTEFGDVRILATGFRDLAVRSIPSAMPPPVPPLSAGSKVAPDAQVVAPVVIRQNLPPWRETLGSVRKDARLGTVSGVLEFTITTAGTVESATLVKHIDPFYDALLLSAARHWKYQPATRNGVPVEYVKTLEINIR